MCGGSQNQSTEELVSPHMTLPSVATASEIAPGDGDLELVRSGRKVGDRIASRMVGVPVRYLNSHASQLPVEILKEHIEMAAPLRRHLVFFHPLVGRYNEAAPVGTARCD